MPAPTVEDLVQTFAKGITRPETEEDDYLPFATNRNFVYARSSGTTAQRPIGVPVGWTYYDTTEESFFGWDGASWVGLGSGAGGLTPPASPADNGKVGIAASGDVVWTSPSALSVGSADYALGLTFGVDIDCGTTPTTNQLLYYNGSALTGIDPGNLLRRKTSSNTSTAALVFTGNVVWTWNGSTTVSLTANLAGAVDGAEITLLFPAGSMNSFALSTDLDPTGLVAGTFTSNLKAYLFRAKYHACGPCIEILSFSEVTDL